MVYDLYVYTSLGAKGLNIPPYPQSNEVASKRSETFSYSNWNAFYLTVRAPHPTNLIVLGVNSLTIIGF